jgi:hypothetical protein
MCCLVEIELLRSSEKYMSRKVTERQASVPGQRELELPRGPGGPPHMATSEFSLSVSRRGVNRTSPKFRKFMKQEAGERLGVTAPLKVGDFRGYRQSRISRE